MTADLKIFREELLVQRQRLGEFDLAPEAVHALDAVITALDCSIERSERATVDLIMTLAPDVPRGKP